MARRRRREEQGVFALALKSGWQLSATLAGGCAFGAVVLIPAFLGHSPILRPLGAMLSTLAWVFAGVFALIALFRGAKSGEEERLPIVPRNAPRSPAPPDRSPPPLRVEPTLLDPAWGYKPASSPPTEPSRPAAWSQDVLDRVEWKRFEDLCCVFYREKGIRAETTRLGADGGIDIRLFQDEDSPERMTAVVQCKAWNQQVGVKEIRELRGVMAHEKVEKAFFMAPQGFTVEARAFAEANRITLLDGRLFLAMIQRLPADANQRLLDFATEGAWTMPTCPSCGTKMVAKDSKRGRFWACPSFPRCRGKLPMRIPDAGRRM